MLLFTRKRILPFVFALLSLCIATVSFAQPSAGALSFDGVNDKILIKRSTIAGTHIGDPSFNISDAITIESWINPESGGGFNVQSVVSKSQRNPNTAQNGYIFPRTNDNWNNIVFLLNFNGLGWRQLTAPYPGKDVWHHVAATYDGSYMRIFIDGVLANQMAITGTITVNNNPLTIGYQNGYTNEFYRGKIDELRIWSRAISACEIASNRNCEITNQSNLVAYYKFNQGLANASNLLENKLNEAGPFANNGELFDFALNGVGSNWTAGIVSGTCAPFTPPVVNVSSNAPSVAIGGTLELAASGGVSYSWTGPNGFTSTAQNPVISNITADASGLYTVTVTTASGCSVPASINIGVSDPARALHFDGLNDIVTIPHSNSLNPNTGITVEAWVFPTDGVSPSQSVIGKSSSNVQGYIFPRTDDGWKSFSFYVHLEGQGWSIISAAYPSINEWHHVAATYDGFTMKIYLDGDLKATKAVTGVISSNVNPVSIGTQPGFSGEFFRGSVDEVRIWNRPLDNCEINNNINIACQLNPSLQTGLAAYYRFNQGVLGVNNSNVNTLLDASGNNNNGQLNNFALNGATSNWTYGRVNDVVCSQFVPIAAQASVNGPILEVGQTLQLSASGGTNYSWTGPNNFTSNQQNPSIPNAQIINSGVYTVSVSDGSCNSNASAQIAVAFKAGTLDFDGVNDQVTVPVNNSLNITEHITLESWIYPTDGSRAIQNVMSKSTARDNNGYIFPRTDDGWKTISFFLHLNGQWKVLTAEYPGLNQWNHVSATYDGYFMRIYINGVLKASTEASGQITSNGNNLVLGQQPGFVEYYRGRVEEAKIWNRALNQCEIINNMNCELQPQQTGLVAYYKFNQGFADAPNVGVNTLIDASGNANNGTLTDFALNGNTSNWASFKVNGTCSTYAEPPVTAQANASVFGIGSTIRLFANGGNAYTWSGPNNFSAFVPDPLILNAQTINSGTYTVAVPFINCTIFRSVRLTVTPLPAIQANGPTVICPSSIVKLSIGSAGTAYQWYRNNVAIPGADSVVHSASLSGSYHVAVTVNGNVQVSAPIEVSVVDNLAPVPNIAQLPVLNLTAPAIVTRPTATDNCAGTVLATTSDPISFTQAGNYTIRWVYNDGNGNEVSQTQQVIVERNDQTPPVLNNLPANITVNCTSVPAPPVVTATDDVDGSVPVSFTEVSTRSTDIFNIAHYNYTITRTWSAVDGSNNSVTASRTVTVVDNAAPVFGTINNINVPTDNNAAGANVNYTAVAVDACNSPVTYTYSKLSGSFFLIGTTTVEVTAKDITGNTATKTFTVTVTDNQPPAITAPANITVHTNAGQAFATGVNLGTPIVSDNSNSGLVISDNRPSQFPIGQTTVTWTVTDAANNSSTATQIVTVKDVEAPVLNVPATVVTVTNNNQAYATNVSLGTPTATDNSGGTVTIANNVPAQYPIGQTQVTWTATDPSGNTTSLIQLVIVEDKQAPVIITPPNRTVGTNAGVNYATGVSLGAASATDNSGLAVSITHNAPSIYNLGQNQVTWTATDAFGNSSTAIQIITVNDTEAPVINGITNIVVDAPTGSNTALVSSLGNPTATDNVQLVSLSNNASGNIYPIGTTTIIWTAIDAANNQNTAIQLVIVRDRTAPVLNGVPANIAVSCSSIPVPATVTATDNYDQTVVVSFNESSTKGTNPSQASFYNYVITRTWTATDVAGNQSSGTQQITVTDTEAPVMVQPINIATNSAAGLCGANVNYTITATDNCGSPISYTYSKASGSLFPIGITTVTVTATDASGNNVSGSFTVTVTDNQPPVITAPANINVTVGTAINLGNATALDNCGITSITNNAPATFPVGVTVVTWTATDGAGNTATATQTVTVVPLTNCTSSITVVPENDTYTGGIPNNIYLGYGPQKVTLRVNASGGSTYTYNWTAISGNGSLSSTTSSQPVFAPTTAGTYIFEVRVRTQAGCVSTSRVTICVKDIRVKEGDDNDDCDHKSHSSKDCKHKDHKHDCDHKSHGSKDCKAKSSYEHDDEGEECDHKSHSSKDCKHKNHKHDCDHKSHDSKDCKSKKYYYHDDDDCDHKSHGSKDCKHKNHKHDCDHKPHDSKDCKAKKYYYDEDDDCDHKSHGSKDCKHKNHKHDCDHKSHDSKYCKAKKYCAEDYDDDDSQKVYLCHVPPGNSSNPQTLRISINAVESHLRNHPGDKLGSCAQQGCTETVVTTTNPTATTTTITAEESVNSTVKKIVPKPLTETDLNIKVMGNPSRSFFTIQMESKFDLPVQVRIFDINGRPMESKANQLPNSTIQVGHNLGSGTYYAEFLQGTRRKVVQLIKVR